ncbi:MAG TPA: hypothetical protein DHU79_00310 [Clostridiales bacterium]|nr:hypothetical protein [Clostridiales bacterium]
MGSLFFFDCTHFSKLYALLMVYALCITIGNLTHYVSRHRCGKRNRNEQASFLFFLCFHDSRRRDFNLLFSCDLVGATMFTFSSRAITIFCEKRLTTS